MKRILIFTYGILCYLIGATAYFVGFGGFLANLLGPYSIDKGRTAPFFLALFINVGLLILFALPHSLMARSSFKKRWTRIIPVAAERSTYMLQAGLLAWLLIWQWRAMPTVIWQIEQPLLNGLIWGLYGLGWLIAFWATLSINHFELTGLQQVYANLRGQEPKPMPLKIPLLYRLVRHPMQFGVLLAFWAAPQMSAGRLLFALGMTVYILVGLHFEERDLVRRFGDRYRVYQQQTPKLLPWPRSHAASYSPFGG
ncbi:MAG: NnrU family protein [Candidatus Promineifilaceae bacterium]|nr:NnrU family protein [Candidatus Promineifilaceae bacterium]